MSDKQTCSWLKEQNRWMPAVCEICRERKRCKKRKEAKDGREEKNKR